MSSLKNRKVIVTGAADGIGRALAIAFAKEGAQVAGCSRGKDRLESLEKEIEGAGHVFFAADLSKAEGVREFFDKAHDAFGGIDILVNNVGAVLKLGNFFEVSDEDWENSFQINLMSAVRLCRMSIPALRESSCPRIINISSIAASHPQEIFPHYNAMKAALSNLTVSLAQTLAENGICVNSISPGPVWSRSWEQEAEAGGGDASSIEEAKKNIMDQTGNNVPLKRMGMPEDLTGLALFLASEQSSWITATNFVVDGGITRNPF
ncbi:MAG: SDR family oxidoreductase [Nitrospinae bacterium]|nr:SDR family oxidoreductase [Nitrospinota bacterium]